MSQLKYSKRKPTRPGWYWCTKSEPKARWEAVVRIDKFPGSELLRCTWLEAPGRALELLDSEWSEECLWAGPLQAPALR